MLQEMADSSIEEDSIMRTPADDDIDDNNESDDEEYSQIFQEDTILFNTQHRSVNILYKITIIF